MDGNLVLKNCHFEIYIPPMEGIANAKESRSIGFQGENLPVYVLVYNRSSDQDAVAGDNVDDVKLKHSTIESHLSALKFQTQLLLHSTGEDVVLKAPHYHDAMTPVSPTLPTSPSNGANSSINTEKVSSKSFEYASVAQARKNINLAKDMENILTSISRQDAAETSSFTENIHHNSSLNIGHDSAASLDGRSKSDGYSYSPLRRSRLSFVSEQDAAPFQNPDHIYKIVTPIHVANQHLGLPLKLVVKVIIDAFSLTIQHDRVFDPEMFEHNRRVQHRVDDLRYSRTSDQTPYSHKGRQSHRDYMSQLVENSIHCGKDPFCRLLSVPFQVLQPLQVNTRSSVIDDVTYINVQTKNTHSKLTLSISEIRFPLNCTSTSGVNRKIDSRYEKGQRLASALQAHLPELQTPVLLSPSEEYNFVIKVEPLPYIFAMPDSIDSVHPVNKSSNGQYTADNVSNQARYGASDKFYTPVTLLWGVHDADVFNAQQGPSSKEDDRPNNPKVRLESTVMSSWTRGVTSTAIRRTLSSNFDKKLAMEVEYDPIVSINNVFTVHVAVTNTTQHVLSNLHLLVPNNSEYVRWEDEIKPLPSKSLTSSISLDDESNLISSMHQLRKSMRLSEKAQYTLAEERVVARARSRSNTFEDVDLTSPNKGQNDSFSNVTEYMNRPEYKSMTSEQVMRRTRDLKTTSNKNSVVKSKPYVSSKDDRLDALPTVDGRTTFHAVFEYSTCNIVDDNSGSWDKKVEMEQQQAKSTISSRSTTSRWISGVPLSSQCVLQVNVDGFRIYVSAPKEKTKNSFLLLSKFWPFTSNVKIHAEKLTNVKIRIDIVEEEMSNGNGKSCISSLYFIVRCSATIVQQFKNLYSMLIGMLRRGHDIESSDRISVNKGVDMNEAENNRNAKKHGGRSNTRVLCLEAKVPLGVLAPADTFFSTIHFIPLKTGTMNYSGIQVENPAENDVYCMDRPFVVTVLPKKSMQKLSRDPSIVAMLPPMSVHEL